MNKYTTALTDQREEILGMDISALCPRPEEAEIDLASPLAQIVIGMRRCGKSTLCQKVLVQSGVTFAYVNFDDERLRDVTADDLNDILRELYTIYGNFTHLLLDEIQNVEAWPLFVNRLLRQRLHIVMTGSNANLLSSELVTHMTGRYHQVELYPFSFAEYCTYRGIAPSSPSTKAIGLRERALLDYLHTGGLPELLHSPGGQAKGYVQSLLRAIVEKDICRRYNLRYKQTIYQLANQMLDWYGQEKSFRSIADELQIKSVHTVRNYLSYLENAYLLRPFTRYSFKSSERSAQRKCYAIDQAFISERDHTLQTEGLGWRLENAVAIELCRRIEYDTQEIFYLRDGRNYEVDFAVVERSRIVELIQVTYDFSAPSTRLYNREIGGLLKAAAATRCERLTLIMMSGETGDLHVDGHTIRRILAPEWFLRQASLNAER